MSLIHWKERKGKERKGKGRKGRKGRKPFLLLDSHDSHFKLTFVNYATYKDHIWVAYTGVSYGTPLWQVGGSSNKNGAYNMALAKAKQYLNRLKQKKKTTPIINPYYNVILVNYVWSQFFGYMTTNRHTTADRICFLLNRAILLNNTL